ncbi:uncharacterized protein [Nicotiana sylvestris]|uniref:uncharacterized protein n=1 Tax=Nicotiana sylvestris TaxID=4096 RepID=UPI00388C5B59
MARTRNSDTDTQDAAQETIATIVAQVELRRLQLRKGRVNPQKVSPPTAAPANTAISPEVGQMVNAINSVMEMFKSFMANQNERRDEIPPQLNRQNNSESSRVNEFLKLSPPLFHGSIANEDPMLWLEGVKKALRGMKAFDDEAVELVAYQLRDVAGTWFEMWEKERDEDDGPPTWEEFEEAFMANFIPEEDRKVKATEYEQLRQGNKSMQEYYMKFIRLAKHAPHMVKTKKAKIRRLVVSHNQTGHGAGRGADRVAQGGGQPLLFATLDRLSAEASAEVITGKANMVADALSMKSMGVLAHLAVQRRSLGQKIQKLTNDGIRLDETEEGGITAYASVQSSLVEHVKAKQDKDPYLVKLKEGVRNKEIIVFTLGSEEVLKLNDRLCVPDVDGLRKAIMEEAHSSRYSIHPGATKMYLDFKELYWWKGMKKQVPRLGTKVNLSTAFHPQTDGQAERAIQTLKDMLRAYVIGFGGNWDDHLPLIEFAYNNNYQVSIGMAPYEALYGRRCRSLVGWFEPVEVPLIGSEFVCEALEKV